MPYDPSPSQTIPAWTRRLSSPVQTLPDVAAERPRVVGPVAIAGIGMTVGAALASAVALRAHPLYASGAGAIGAAGLGLLAATRHRLGSFVSARSHERERQKAQGRRVGLLLDSARALTEQSSEPAVYEQLRRYAESLVPHDAFALAIFHGDGVLAGRYSAAGIIDGLNALPTEGELSVVRSRKALLDAWGATASLDLTTGKTGVPLDEVRDAYVPVFAGRELVGVVTVRRTHPGYTAEEVDALAALCQQAGIAIGRARLFMQVVTAKREWERVFDATAEGLALIDTDGILRRCNAAFAAFANTSFGSAVGQHHHRVGSFELGRGDDCAICKAIRSGSRAERMIEDADGRKLRMTLSPYPTGGVVLVAQDVTAEAQMRDAEQQLFESEKFAAIGRLAAGVAHEVNNPLMGINSLATVLLEDRAFEGENRDMVAMIQRESRRAAQVTRDLLSFVRVDDHQRGDVSLNELAREVVELRAVQQKAAGVTTTLELAETLPTVKASRAQILQVLVNLVTNAEDALEGRTKKEIRISTYHSGGAVMLRVEDNGPGIADEHKARLFEPFFTTKAPGKGTGLGLALSFAIADRHGGSLRAGDAPGGGARFTIELPLEAVRVAA